MYHTITVMTKALRGLYYFSTLITEQATNGNCTFTVVPSSADVICPIGQI